MILNLWDATKTILRGKFISNTSLPQKQEKSQVNSLTLNIKPTRGKRTNNTQS